MPRHEPSYGETRIANASNLFNCRITNRCHLMTAPAAVPWLGAILSHVSIVSAGEFCETATVAPVPALGGGPLNGGRRRAWRAWLGDPGESAARGAGCPFALVFLGLFGVALCWAASCACRRGRSARSGLNRWLLVALAAAPSPLDRGRSARPAAAAAGPSAESSCAPPRRSRRGLVRLTSGAGMAGLRQLALLRSRRRSRRRRERGQVTLQVAKAAAKRNRQAGRGGLGGAA